MTITNTNIQTALVNNAPHAKSIKADHVGKETFKTWKKNVESVQVAAFEVYRLTHDFAGRDIQAEDSEALKNANTALAGAIKAVLAMVGHGMTADNKEFKILCNPELMALAVNFSNKDGYIRSEEAEEAKTAHDIAAANLTYCKKQYELVNVNGANPARVEQALAAITAAEAEEAATKSKQEELESQPWGKVKGRVQSGDSAFRASFEKALADILNDTKQKTLAELKAIAAARKAAKQAATAARKATTN